MRRVVMTLSLLLACVAVRALLATRPAPVLRIATWNMEWLLAPHTALAARNACRAHRRSPVPCDVARGLARDSADLARLAAHARRLDADVIAFQEVEDARTARRVFRGYDICMTRGSGVQQVGFAVRRNLPHRCGEPFDALASGGRGRAGMTLALQPKGLPAMELLAVHLKSGCAREPLDTGTAACRQLREQGQALAGWIAARAAQGAAFIVLGDFNRGGSPASGDPFWERLDPAAFHAAASVLPFSNCAIGQPYTDYIDHILVGQALAGRLLPHGYGHLTYRPRDAAHHRLSDHCPVSVSLSRS